MRQVTGWMQIRNVVVSLALALAAMASIHAVAAAKIEGHASVNGKSTPLTFAAAGTAENLFDDKKKDVIVLLADHAVPADLAADDEVGISLHARKGEFRAVMLRIDTTKKLLNVKLFDKGIAGLVMFAAKDFELIPGTIDMKTAAGRIHTKAPTTFSGTTLELDATFDAAVGAAANAAAQPAAPVSAPAAPRPDASVALNQILLKHLTFTPTDFLTAVASQQTDVVKLYLDAGMSPDTPGGPGTPLFGAKTPLVWAIMMQNAPMAVDLVKAGADVKKADANGMTALTWAVESCVIPAVQAIVDAKADVNHVRAGMTMLQEAGACPAAAAILKKAGAK